MFSGIGKTARGAGTRRRRGHPLRQCRIRARARAAARRSPPARVATRRHLAPRQSGRRCPDPRQDRHRQVREQVRHSDQPRACGLCAGGEAARARRSPASTCISAARSPSSSRSTRPLRCCPISCEPCAPMAMHISHVDLGGGLGIPYRDDNEPPPHPRRLCRYGQARDARSRLHVDLRAGAVDRRQCRHPGDACALPEARRAKTFVIVDAAMNDLIRPTLYDAHHDIWPVREPPPGAPPHRGRRGGAGVRIRRFLGARSGPGRARAGDLIAVMTAGAYGAVQAGTYNTRPLVPEVLVREGEWALVRPRLGDRRPDRARSRLSAVALSSR